MQLLVAIYLGQLRDTLRGEDAKNQDIRINLSI